MGLIFTEYGQDKDVYYTCAWCDTPLFKIEDMAITVGHCSEGLTYTFDGGINLLTHPEPMRVQMFYGEGTFLLDIDPIDNPETVMARSVGCRGCMNHLGWILDSDNFVILKNSIF